MAVKGKGKQVAGKAPASTASFSGKRKSTRAHGESSGALPKKKCSGVSQFVDDVAADADFEGGEEEEEEDDFEWEMDEDFDFELPDIGAKEVKNGTKGPGKSSPLPFFIKEEELNDDELEEAIKERYRGSGFVSFDEDVKECDESLSVAHATKNLSFWRVKCMMGRERQTAFCLMQKFVDLLKIGKQLQIFSVFALDHVKGFVYVEADKACNVFEACNGLCFMYPSRIELVPRNEAPNLLSIQKKACGISKGMWVRMKNGKYKGDLAEVVLVNDAKKRVTIKLVPRIDLQAIAKKFGGGTSLKAAAITAPRLISSHELEDFRPHIEVRRDRETGEIFEVLDGLMLKDGYLYKKVSMGSLIHWGVQPSSDELAKFEDLCMDEVKDVSWLSSIYKTKMKKKLPEASIQRNGEKSNLKNVEKSNQKDGEKSNHKDGEKSNQMDGDRQRNDFDIDDFVLFGKKDCGIIIDKENDTFKVLKGDVIGSEVVTINIRVIKKNCVDKVFTATDRCKKTISIDDVVKVFEGPSEGREGIVRHMYKGVLFIYDECQSENNGFFCAKSAICDLVKKSRDFGGGKLGSNVGPSFAQSPIRSSKEDDNSQSFSRNGQSNSRGTFSVGQTLRICKGPLKGYLCRVIRIYRADVTVKLDSLGKLLTVDEKLLSFSNSKRDDATAMQCDIFGSEEGQSAGGGLGMDNFEFNAGMSSFGRDSWNTPSCSNFSFSRDNDNKDQNQVADPWGSKLSSWNGDQDQGAANSWGKAPSSSAEQSSWNKMVNEEKGSDANCKNDADSWNKASTKGETSTGGTPNSWGKAPSSSAEQSSWNKKVNEEKGSDANCKNDADAWNKASTKGETSTGGTPFQKTDLTWSTKGATSGWDSAVTVVDSDAGGWNKARLSTTDSESVEGQALGEDGWNRTKSKPHTVSSTETSGWERTKLPSSDGCGNWNTQGADADGNKETSGKDRAEGFGGQMGNWVSPKSGGGDNLDSWGIKGKGLLGINDDSWSKSAASKETKPVDKNPWQSSFNSSVQSKAWKTTSVDEKTAPSHIGCEKSEAGSTETGGWKKSTDGNQAAGWAATAMHSGTSSFEDGSQSNSWSKVKSLPSSGGWEKSKATVTETVGGWKATTDSNQAAGWGTAMPSATPSIEHESQTSSWDKVSISPSSSQWQISKPADATAKEGWKKDGFSGEGQIDRWNKEKSSNRDQASGWNKAGNGEGGKDAWTDSWDKAKSSEGSGFGQESRGQWKSGGDWRNNHHDPNLGKSNDSDTGQGLGWSEGQSNNESGKSWGYGNSCSWNQQRDFDGGRGSGRGSGRGRYGGRGGRNKDNFENPDGSDGGWRFGRGGGRGRNGAGGYNRDNSDTREFGRGRGRGRGRGERFGSYSNKPPSSWGSTEVSDWGKSRDQHSAGASWNSGNSYDRGNKPSWGTDPQDAGGSKNEMNEDHDSGWSKGVNTGKQIDNCSKETRKNDNWNTPKTFDNKLSSWNQTSNDTAKDTTSIQSTDWVHGLSETKVTTNDDKWTKAKSSSGDHGDTFSGKSNSNDWCKTATPNEENEAADSQGGWSSKKAGQASQPSSETVNNWGKLKETCSGNTAGNLGSSEGWTENSSANWDSRSNGWDSKKELTSGQSNWGGEDSAGNRPSDWSNGGGNKSSKQSGSRGNSQSWSHGSDSGRGGGRRDNSFSRGRGFGRNSGGRHSCSWNSSDDSAKEDNEESKTGGSWSKGHGTSEGGKSSWNSGGNAEKGSWGSWKSEGTDQSADQAKQRCGWTASASASVNTVEGSSVDGSWNLVNSEGWTDNDWVNCDSRSRSCDSKKVPTSIQGNWGSKDSSGDQSSDWENGDGNKWNKQLGSQDKSESWSQRSDFGRGGGIGRGNSFSGRGRGLGRNSGGRHSSSWNSSDDYGIKGDDRGQAFNLNQEFRTGGPWSKGHGTSEGERGSWTSGGNAEKGSWGSSKSEGEIQPANQAKQGGSGWTASAFSADGSTNWNSGSSSLDTKEEPIANQPSWGGNDYSVRQSSGWENGDGNKWNKQTGSQDRLESWSRQSDFGRGGGRGRHSSFSGRGRSLGRNSGGRGYGKEGNDGWQASNSNQEFKTGGSWNSGGNAERSSRGGWKLEGEDQPAGRANPGSESEGGKGSWDQAESPKWQ